MLQRRSILVRTAVYQEGPKNPLKGISVKLLVSALNAQFGVDAGGKRDIAGSAPQAALQVPGWIHFARPARYITLALSGRPPMAWGRSPCQRGDLTLCRETGTNQA